MKYQNTQISINVSDEEREAIKVLAHKRGHKIISDYLRKLIIEDGERHGQPIRFRVNRGGWREKSA